MSRTAFRGVSSHSIGLAMLLALLAGGGLAATSVKRGFVADTRNGTCDDPFLLANATSWYYDYNVQDPYRDRLGCARGGPQAFVPMHWCLSSINATVPSYVDTTFMLGFNEPNNIHNCGAHGRTPEMLARAWAQIMQQFPTSKLVTPATAGNGIPWFREWFGNCTQLYGASGCNVTHMALHSYTCNATKLLKYLTEVHEEFGLPIWLTEFACGDHTNHKPLAEQLAFMRETLPLLDASPIVFRYAWFAAHTDASDNDHRSLFQPGKAELSELGLLYTSLPMPAKQQPPNALADCAEYETALAKAKATFCASGFCPAPQGVEAKKDWPSQVTYMHAILDALASDAHCYDSSAVARDTLAWLEKNQTNEGGPSSFGPTWTVFQAQYFDMPRKPGVRIEAPDTLGRKCWAFAYLDQICDVAPIAPRAPTFAVEWARAVPRTLELCVEVLANCFVNASYDPHRNGTCPTQVFAFHNLGFERENLLRGFDVAYPFLGDDRSVVEEIA